MTAPPLLSPKTAVQTTTANHTRTPSPNYFGFTAADDSYDSESARHARKNWSPPSSAVRSTAAFSPTVVPVDQNPDFDAFRRQSESMVFNLGSLHNFKQTHELEFAYTAGRGVESSFLTLGASSSFSKSSSKAANSSIYRRSTYSSPFS